MKYKYMSNGAEVARSGETQRKKVAWHLSDLGIIMHGIAYVAPKLAASMAIAAAAAYLHDIASAAPIVSGGMGGISWHRGASK